MLQIDRIISVSSEDPAWPADNLLKSQGKSNKWKCKGGGERSASVVLQLGKASRINGIDVGNENSAFIEILVGKSCSPDNDFKVLLVASSLMSLKEAKDLSNSNGVRFFKEDNFCRPESEEKWDRVKIVCSQPYNKQVQFGLSFVTFHGDPQPQPSASSAEPGSTKTTALGKFLLKEENDDRIAIGSIFARRKQLQSEDTNKTSAVAIRTATTQLQATNGVSENRPTTPKPVVKTKVPPARVEKKRQDAASNAEPQSSNRKVDNLKRNKPPIDTPDAGTPNRKRVKKDDRIDSDRSGEEASGKNTSRFKAAASSRANDKLYKPFGELLRGVVFTISGIQNPLRSDVRNKALALGAKYRPDWDGTCTHLVCAFINTPKFNQVKGHGKIVKKDWIEQCFTKRTRFPWRRYALDPTDGKKTESEDEILEEDESVSNSRLSADSESDRPSEARPPSLFADIPKRTPRHKGNLSDNSSPRAKKTSPKKTSSSKDKIAVDADTEAGPSNHTASTNHSSLQKDDAVGEPEETVDLNLNLSHEYDEESSADTESDADWPDRKMCNTDEDAYPLPHLPEQFSDISFHIADDVTSVIGARIKRYITAHSGSVVDTCTQDTEYVIAAKSVTVDKLKEICPNIVGVRAEWVWRCHDENRLLPTSNFEL